MLDASKNRDQTREKKKARRKKGKRKTLDLGFFGGVLLWQLEQRNRCVFLGRNGGVWSEHASGFVAFPGVIPGRQVVLSAQWRGSGHSRAPQPVRPQLVFHVVHPYCTYIYFYLYSIVFKIAVRPRGHLSAFHCPFIVGKNAMNKNLNVTC